MVKVKFIKSVNGGDFQYEKGKVYSLTPNEAHTYIELRIAKVFREQEEKDFEEPPKDKMIRKARGRKKIIKV